MTGSLIASMAFKYMKRCEMELGGADNHVFFNDVDPKENVKGIVAGRLANNGQVCTSPKRIFIHEEIFDDFSNLIVEEVNQQMKTEKYKNGILYGSDAIEQKVQDQLKRAVENDTNDSVVFLRGNYNDNCTQDILVIEVKGNFL